MKPSYHCPICQEIGISLPAIYARDTSNATTQGSFKGGTVGISVGSKQNGYVGSGFGGTFKANTDTMTTLAKQFEPIKAPPQPTSPVHISVTFVMFIAMMILMIMATYTYDAMIQNAADNLSYLRTATVPQSMSEAIIYFINTDKYFILIFILFGFLAYFNFRKYNKPLLIRQRFTEQLLTYKAEYKNYLRLTKKYKEMRYCERCHVVYDQQGNQQHADTHGYNNILHV